jgi:hypothetical protein
MAARQKLWRTTPISEPIIRTPSTSIEKVNGAPRFAASCA